MAGKSRDRRIEPTFDNGAARRSGSMSVREEDRVVPSRKKPKAKGARGASASRKARPRRRSLLGRMIYWCFVLALWGGIAAAGLVVYYGAKMPSVTTWSVPDRPPNVKIVSVDGQLLANRGMTGGEAVGIHEMSPYIPQAVIAIEDRRFYSHFGV
ncbi:penicillin-binding protein, partial [Salmonella enterica subsp. enterica]|nr:penicillin-binding protein [Salmonella enterica subsp. enterica serovar Paratyphi A]